MNETISQINVNGTLYDIEATSIAGVGSIVTSVVSQTGDVTATQIATALTAGGYKLTDNNTWTAASTSAAGYVPAATKGKFLHSNASTGALEWVDDNNSTYTAGTGLSLSGAQFSLATSGVTAGTYKRVTVDQYGRVTSGDNTDANDNTWRKVQLDGVDKLGTGTNTNPLNIKAGSNMSITESNGTFTFAASFTDNDTNTAQLQVSDTTNKRINTAESTGKYIQFTGGTDKFTVSDGTNSFDVAVSHTNDGDTKNTTGTTNKAATKLFLAGAESQAANPVTYSNVNCYIGTDNCLYSNGSKVITDIAGKADKASITAGTAGTSSATSGDNITIPYVTVNAQGIVTGYGTHTHTIQHQSIAGKQDKIALNSTAGTTGSIALNCDTMYNIGTLTGNVTFSLNAAPDDGYLHEYLFAFDTGATAYTVTMPTGVLFPSTVTIAANKHYEVNIKGSYGLIASW